MITGKLAAVAVAIQFLAGPVVAQVASNADKNAHHYSGGPATGTPHMINHPRQKNVAAKARTTATTNGHHYGGGPKSENHDMGDKQ
jgi:hypothetical protein